MSKLKHIIQEGLIYFVTTTVQKRQQLFLDSDSSKIVIGVLQELHNKKLFELYAFVLMPDHLHLILKPTGMPLSSIMKNLKGKSSRLINRHRQTHGGLW